MNFINLLSILESKDNLSDELFKKYLEYLNVILKDNEIEDLLKLIKKLVGECQSSNIFDGYYIGYRIPQISKEFDLLRITENSVINITPDNILATLKEFIYDSQKLREIGGSARCFAHKWHSPQAVAKEVSNFI